jgi:hypothetical protein
MKAASILGLLLISISVSTDIAAQSRKTIALTPVVMAPRANDVYSVAGQLGATLAGALKSSGRFEAVLDRDMNTVVFQELARAQAFSNFESTVAVKTTSQTNAQVIAFAMIDEVTVADCEGTGVRGSDGKMIPRAYVAQIRMRLKFSNVESGETIDSDRLVIKSEAPSAAVTAMTSGGGWRNFFRAVGKYGCTSSQREAVDHAIVNAEHEFIAYIFNIYPVRIVDVALDSLGGVSRFTIDAGRRHGFTTQQKFKVWEQVAMAFDDRKRLVQLGELRVVRIEDELAECEVLSGGAAILEGMKKRREKIVVKR